MPVLSCPNCSAKLNATAAAAGKRVKCPKCQTPIPVPAPDEDPGFEVVDDSEPASAPKPVVRPAKAVPAKAVAAKAAPIADDAGGPKHRKASRKADDDGGGEDEDDYDDDNRPRKKPTAKAKAKSKVPMILAGCGGAAVLGIVAILGLGWYLTNDTIERNKNGGLGPNGGQDWNLANAGGNPNPPTKAPTVNRGPAGWIPFNDPKGNFTVSFPVAPALLEPDAIIDENIALMGNKLPAKDKADVRTAGVQLMRDMSTYRYAASSVGRKYAITVQKIDSGPLAGVDAKTALDQTTAGYASSIKLLGGRVTNTADSEVNGLRTVTLTVVTPSGKGQINRYFVYGRTFFTLSGEGESQIHPQDILTKGFFDSFTTTLKP